MSLPPGTIDIQILADGTVRSETGDMAGPSHRSADDFLKLVAALLAGEEIKSKSEAEHQHPRDHTHPHTHEHE